MTSSSKMDFNILNPSGKQKLSFDPVFTKEEPTEISIWKSLNVIFVFLRILKVENCSKLFNQLFVGFLVL